MEDISANPGGLLGRLGNESFLTHLLARSNPAMLASAHVGELRGLRTTRKTKKFSMTEEVLDIANLIAADLQQLQNDYLELHLRARGAPPESKQGAWGKLHIVSGLMQQLKEEVNKEMEATRDTGKLITVYTKREAWSKRAAPEWRSAFLANQKMDKLQEEKTGLMAKRHHAAASIIQTMWRVRRREKQDFVDSARRSKEELVRDVNVQSRSKALETLRDNDHMKQRETNRLRKELKYSVRQMEGIATEYGEDGSLLQFAEDGTSRRRLQAASPIAETSETAPSRRESSSSSEEEEQPEDRRRSRRLLGATRQGAAKPVADKDTVGSRKLNRKARLAKRIHDLSAPKARIDLEEHQKRVQRENGPAWRGSGAFQTPKAQANAQSAWNPRKKMDEGKVDGKPMRPLSGNLLALQGQLGKYVPSTGHWSRLRIQVQDRQAMSRLKRLHLASRPSWKRIPATRSMRFKLEGAQRNFEELTNKLDDWVKRHRHVLELIADDASHPHAPRMEVSEDTKKQKAAVGQQMLVLSTMWGMMKNNLLQAQEAILGADFVEKMEDRFSIEDLKDGSATVMKMWRDISETVSPLRVALGNQDPEVLVANMMENARNDKRMTKSRVKDKAQDMSKNIAAFEFEGAAAFQQQPEKQQHALHQPLWPAKRPGGKFGHAPMHVANNGSDAAAISASGVQFGRLDAASYPEFGGNPSGMPPKAGGVSNQDQSGLCSTPADVATTAEPEKIGKSGNDKPSTRSHMHINPSNAENQSSSDATRAAGGSTNPAEPDLERKGHSYPLPDTADMTVAAYASASGLDDGYAKAGTEEDLGLSVLGRGGLRPDSRSHKRHSFALPEVPGFALAELSMDRGAGTQSRVDILLEQHTDILDRQGLAPSEFHEGPSSQPMQNGDADGAGGRTRIWRNFGAQSRDPGGPHGMTPFHRQPPAFGPRMLASRNTRVKSLVHECDDFLKATELGTTAGCGTHQQASGTVSGDSRQRHNASSANLPRIHQVSAGVHPPQHPACVKPGALQTLSASRAPVAGRVFQARGELKGDRKGFRVAPPRLPYQPSTPQRLPAVTRSTDTSRNLQTFPPDFAAIEHGEVRPATMPDHLGPLRGHETLPLHYHRSNIASQPLPSLSSCSTSSSRAR